MRTLRLAEAVAQAERLRLRAMAGRMATRAMFAVAGVIFALYALLGINAALVVLLLRTVALGWACLIVAAGNLLIAVLLVLLAMRNTPSIAEIEALQLRRQAWLGVKRDLAFSGMLSTALALWRRRRQTGGR